MVRLVSGVVLPTAAVNVVVPVLFTASAFAPSTAPVNVVLPVPVDTVRSLNSVVAPVKETLLLVVASVALKPLMTTLSPYDCAPVVVIAPPMLLKRAA